MGRVALALVPVLLVATPHETPAQPGACVVEPFKGATLPEGAVAHMHVTNTAAACAITVFGLPGDRRHPAEAGSITVSPSHGVAEFVPPQAVYKPQPGFVGDDAFSFEALAKGQDVRQTVRLKVRVMVHVKAP